jgi:CheY-like chemotaxis protein
MHKVLVIDDEKATLTMFKLFLGAFGYHVLVAENGKTGIELLIKENPPIVFTDLKMPEMDGFEVLKKIKKLAPDTEVIVITGHGDMEMVLQALNLEATDFINKPIKRTALDSALKRAEARLTNKDKGLTRLSLTQDRHIAVIQILGTLTRSCRFELLDLFESACAKTPRGIIFHFESNAAVDGMGISMLSKVLTDSKSRGQAVAFSGLSENFREIFKMVGLTRYVAIYETEKDARDSFK